jgi:aspartate-semialdehyde dehydrogenase
VVVAHPAATALALLLARLQKATPLRLVSTVIGQPASEYGRAGMDELHEQTVNLLSFQTLPSAVFGTQVAFNVFTQPLKEAQASLAGVEERIQRHFATITAGQLEMPAILLVQVPVFHGYTFSIFLQTAEETTPEALSAALAGPHIKLLAEGDEFPSNVSVAGSQEILANVRADGAAPGGYWITAACDNLRLSAMQAVECAEEMAQTRPWGKLQ